jgi:hypothetical protein
MSLNSLRPTVWARSEQSFVVVSDRRCSPSQSDPQLAIANPRKIHLWSWKKRVKWEWWCCERSPCR